MKTLTKDITGTYITPDQRDELIKAWKSGQIKQHSCTIQLIYKALLGKDWRKGFAKIKNELWVPRQRSPRSPSDPE